MIRILVDAREAVRNKSGIGTVAREFVKRLPGCSSDAIEFMIVKPEEKRISDSKLIRLLEFLWWKSFYIYFMRKIHKCDYIFSLDSVPCLLSRKCVSVIYDMIFFVYPEWTGLWGKLWRLLLPLSINNNKLIFFNSQCTFDDTYKYIPNADKSIPTRLIYWGVDSCYTHDSGHEEESIIDHQYILFIGNAEPRRNLQKVMTTLARYNAKSGQNIHLVVVGNNKDYQHSIDKWATDLGINDVLHVAGYVTNEQLATYYRKAIAYLYPSYYEGFGLTILEAQACGCPVITSDTPALREISGGACLTVNPDDQAQLDQALTDILSSESLRQRLVANGYANCKKFNWDVTMETVTRSMIELGK